jgi:hypothetical protein
VAESNALNLYENIVIGNFLFNLGVRMAKLRPHLPPVSVNLLQQTPLDKSLADVLLANAGLCRLIEFKRKGKLTTKETMKLTALRDGLRTAPGYETHSRQIHWFVQIDEPKMLGELLVTKACPYLDFSDDPEFIDINAFAQSIAQEACLETPDDELRSLRARHIRWVAKTFTNIERTAKEAEEEKASTGTLAIAVDENGRTSWFAVPSIEYVLMTRYELSRELGLGLGPGERKYERISGLDRGISR